MQSIVKSIVNSIVALLVAGACLATPCAPAAERFASDKPTPLKRLKPGKDDTAVRFAGTVQLTGQFAVVWELKNDTAFYRRITFFPDGGSAALLPRPAGDKAVAELLLSNPDKAGAMLRDLATLEKQLPREQIVSQGAATVTIRDYRAVVDCDHRWYLAELVSAARKDIVVAAREGHPGC
jgi:hypothetical protein